MITSRFLTCLENFTWLPSNDGQPYHDDPNDPGGATSWGVTYTTYCSWLLNNNLPAIDLTQFASLPNTAFIPVYQNAFWDAVDANQLSIGLDLLVFDCSVVTGVSTAVRILQDCLRITADGILGPQTRRAITENANSINLEDYVMRQKTYFASCVDYPLYGRGWFRRVNDALTQAITDQTTASKTV